MLRIKKYNKISLVIFFVFITFSLIGQNSPDSLSAYLEIAAKNNPNVIQKFYEYQAALQKVPQVGSLADPELSIGYFLKPMEQIGGSQVADFRLMQMFPWVGTLKAAKDEMSMMAKAKYESFRQAKSTVFYNVEITWYELYKNEKEIQITTKNIEILKMIEQLALVKFKSSGQGNITSSVSSATMQNSSSAVSSSTGSGMQNMTGSSTSPGTSSNQAMQSGSMSSGTSGSGLADLFRIQIAIGDLQNDSILYQSIKKTISAKFNLYLNRSEQTEIILPDTLKLSALSMT